MNFEQASSRWTIPIALATRDLTSVNPSVNETALFASILDKHDLSGAGANEVHVRVHIQAQDDGTAYNYQFFRFIENESSVINLCSKFLDPPSLDNYALSFDEVMDYLARQKNVLHVLPKYDEERMMADMRASWETPVYTEPTCVDLKRKLALSEYDSGRYRKRSRFRKVHWEKTKNVQ
jgi:hypothetical protein